MLRRPAPGTTRAKEKAGADEDEEDEDEEDEEDEDEEDEDDEDEDEEDEDEVARAAPQALQDSSTSPLFRVQRWQDHIRFRCCE